MSATSPLVVRVTVRSPRAACDRIVIFAVACVASVILSESTLISAPKSAVVPPCSQCVACPTRTTFKVWFCVAWFGVTERIWYAPFVTVRPDPITTSDPVMATTEFVPMGAIGEITISAVMDVALLTVILLTVTPAPSSSCVTPCTQCVPTPVIASPVRLCPCAPLPSNESVSSGVPGLSI